MKKLTLILMAITIGLLLSATAFAFGPRPGYGPGYGPAVARHGMGILRECRLR